jgi:hypothetical protein
VMQVLVNAALSTDDPATGTYIGPDGHVIRSHRRRLAMWPGRQAGLDAAGSA